MNTPEQFPVVEVAPVAVESAPVKAKKAPKAPKAAKASMALENITYEEGTLMVPLTTLKDDQGNLTRPSGVPEDKEFEALVSSIATSGQVNPVIVRREGDHFRLIAGFRRAQACRVAGLPTVLARVMTSGSTALVNTAENSNRLEIDGPGRIAAVVALLAEGRTVDEITATTGMVRDLVTDCRHVAASPVCMAAAQAEADDIDSLPVALDGKDVEVPRCSWAVLRRIARKPKGEQLPAIKRYGGLSFAKFIAAEKADRDAPKGKAAEEPKGKAAEDAGEGEGDGEGSNDNGSSGAGEEIRALKRSLKAAQSQLARARKGAAKLDVAVTSATKAAILGDLSKVIAALKQADTASHNVQVALQEAEGAGNADDEVRGEE